MTPDDSVEFFETQFRRQARERDYALNPFEINSDAQRERLPVRAIQADIGSWSIDRTYDTIVAIGLLMFFRDVLTEGTTYMGMFDPENYYLFSRNELEEQFAGWKILAARHEAFPAPGETRKEFSTVIAEKP